MPPIIKRVPAVDKCFSILKLFSKAKQTLGISDIAHQLDLNKSTVFNIIHTLVDLQILEQCPDNKFKLGLQLFSLGHAARKNSDFIQMLHPYLEKINQETKLSAFLGMRSGLHAVIIDKADTAFNIKLASEVGMRLPLLAGAGGMALLCQLPDNEIDQILSNNKLQRFTPVSITNKRAYKTAVLKVREKGVAIEWEEYIEGIVAFAIPLNFHQVETQVAIWSVGLKRQVPKKNIPKICTYFIKTAAEINSQLMSINEPIHTINLNN
jgi:IclR family KDG regulon transcriptional repressor